MANTPSLEAAQAFYEPFLAYTNEQTPTFTDNFLVADMVWGETSEGLSIFSMVEDGALRITDHGDSSTFPTNGLFDATNFIIQFDFSFAQAHKADEISIQFRSSQNQNIGYKISINIFGEWWLTETFGTALISNGQKLPKQGYNNSSF